MSLEANTQTNASRPTMTSTGIESNDNKEHSEILVVDTLLQHYQNCANDLEKHKNQLMLTLSELNKSQDTLSSHRKPETIREVACRVLENSKRKTGWASVPWGNEGEDYIKIREYTGPLLINTIAEQLSKISNHSERLNIKIDLPEHMQHILDTNSNTRKFYNANVYDSILSDYQTIALPGSQEPGHFIPGKPFIKDSKDMIEVAQGSYQFTSAHDEHPILKTYNLKPCVGIILYDPATRQAGLLHEDKSSNEIHKDIDHLLNSMYPHRPTKADKEKLQVTLIAGRSWGDYTRDEKRNSQTKKALVALKALEINNIIFSEPPDIPYVVRNIAVDSRTGEIYNLSTLDHIYSDQGIYPPDNWIN